MAWIRRVRTASGATAVQIAESVGGRRRIVRHVGSARNDAELGLLMDQARQLLIDDGQGMLDLGITPPARQTSMLLPPAPSTLFPAAADRPAHPPTVAAPRVLKTSSGLLFEALAAVYADLGFDAVGDEVFRDLVMLRDIAADVARGSLPPHLAVLHGDTRPERAAHQTRPTPGRFASWHRRGGLRLGRLERRLERGRNAARLLRGRTRHRPARGVRGRRHRAHRCHLRARYLLPQRVIVDACPFCLASASRWGTTVNFGSLALARPAS